MIWCDNQPSEALTKLGIEMIVKKVAEDAGVQRYVMTKLVKCIAQVWFQEVSVRE